MSLSQQTAIKRAGLIRQGSIQYNFHIILSDTSYNGLAQIVFYLQTLNFKEDLEIDFQGDEVQALIVNDLEIELDDHERENFIFLPRECLQKGKNRVTVMYNSEYNHDHAGLISFVDNEEQFLFTDFEPYYASRVFPCFDQPNLKAVMRLTVIGREDWRILSNEDPIRSQSFKVDKYLKNIEWSHQKSKRLLDVFSKKVVNSDSLKITSFPFTKILPTYIFCFAAGNYQPIYPSRQTTVPMTIYCTKASMQNMQRYAGLIFDVTIQCMAFYYQKFGVKYPFNKYDQIFIKEFGAWAMQNAGIVTFDMDKLPKETPTTYDKYIISVVVSHELSHHWFGNYVTMVWWDDLWLNQSFAEWMSCYSMQKLKDIFKFESYFYFREGKMRGYEDDQRNNATHPIRGVVANTDEAFSIFDGITYEKGASALKQLTYLVGEDKFFTAISNYFKRFEWSNATIDDLLEDIKPFFPEEAGSLDDWKKTWLEEPSLNVFSIDWNQDASKIIIKQSSFDGLDVLRVHKIKIALFNANGKFTTIPGGIIINQTSQTEVIYADGPYSAVLVNHEDWTFAENIIDPVSLSFFMKNIDKIEDLFARMMIWYNFRSMVNLSCMTIVDYVDLIKEKLFLESSTFIFQQILENLYSYLSNFINKSLGDYLRSLVCQLIYKSLQTTDKTQLERIQILQDYYVKYAKSQDEILSLWNWLNKSDPLLAGRQMNFNQKWSTVKKIFTLNISANEKWDVFKQIESQQIDPSRAQQNKTILTVLLANEQQFETVYEQFKHSDVSLTMKYLKVQGWHNQYHYDWIVNKYQDRYYQDIIKVSQTLSYQEFEFFYSYLGPIDRDLQRQIQKYNYVITKLEELGDLDEHCRQLRKIIDDLTLRIQNTAFNADVNRALSKNRAIERYSYIQQSSTSYKYHLAFVKQEPYYFGMAEISFILNQVPFLLPLDCVCDTIFNLHVNQIPVTPVIDGQFLFIPQDKLAVGANTITIHYRNKFNNDGLGCMSYIEVIQDLPRKQYIYTNFEPYGAHRFVPCFDQPDFRAAALFNIIVPTGWMAVGNQSVGYDANFTIDDYKKQIPTSDQAMLDEYLTSKQGYYYSLKPTPNISTYLYCIAVGEYYRIEVKQDKLWRKIPMNLYCISSYAARLDRMADFIIQITTLSLELFQSDFGIDYPFSKYDTIFCHEYKPGAMQNPGLITFKDTYLYADQKVSLEKMLSFASTIIHENSHNWFGNYVTMKWWDDLWLNESFADFIAHYGLQQLKNKVTTIPTYDSGWKIFLVRGVPGYRQDQITETTHAVRSEVENTSVAATYFDRITYQKGSATLKQLMFLMGKDNFFLGLKDYFRQFGWKNTTIDDFLNKMQTYFDSKTTGFTLDDWKASWLLTPSLNTVSINWNPEDTSPTATLTIHQDYYSNVYPTLRYHSTRVAFFKDDATYEVQDVLLTPTSTTTLTYDGTKGYKAILVNVDYWDYFKYTIDDTSLQFFKQNLNKIDNVLTRMIIWHDINEQVRDANYKVTDYIDIFNKFIFDETDDKIFEFQFSFVRDALNNYIEIGQRPPLKSQIFQSIYNKLKSLNNDGKNDLPNRKILLKDQLTIFAAQSNEVDRLQDWREDNNDDLKSFPITISQAWQVIKLVFASSDISAQLKQQYYQDQYSFAPGIQGQLTRNTCDAIIADNTKFQSIYNDFKAMELSLDVKESYAAGWNHLIHLDTLRNVYKSRYFTDLPALSKTLLSNHFEFFYQNLKPIDDKLQETIDAYSKIKLEGSNMLGHIKVLTQIKYGYQLRLKLYTYNQ